MLLGFPINLFRKQKLEIPVQIRVVLFKFLQIEALVMLHVRLIVVRGRISRYGRRRQIIQTSDPSFSDFEVV